MEDSHCGVATPWQAVVNEDTRGEASLLLLENARLRQELQAFYTLQYVRAPDIPMTEIVDKLLMHHSLQPGQEHAIHGDA